MTSMVSAELAPLHAAAGAAYLKALHIFQQQVRGLMFEAVEDIQDVPKAAVAVIRRAQLVACGSTIDLVHSEKQYELRNSHILR